MFNGVMRGLIERISLIAVVGIVLSACGGQAAPVSSAASPSARTSSGAASKGTSAPASASAGASAASPSTSAQAASGTLTTLKVAQVASNMLYPLYVSIDKGYMRQQGLNLDLTTVSAGQDAIALTATGKLDATFGAPSSGLFNAINQGLDIKFVASLGVHPQTGDKGGFMVRADELQSGAIKSAADLKGKKIAIPGGNGAFGVYIVSLVLDKAKLTIKDVDVENLGFPDMTAAFKNKAIDAAIVIAPFSTEIDKAGLAKIPEWGNVEAGISGIGLMYGPRLLEKQPEIGKKLLTALVRGARDVQGSKAEDPGNLAILSKYMKLPVSAVQATGLYDVWPDLHVDTDHFMAMQKVFLQAGTQKTNGLLPASKWADPSLLKAALAASG